jgi:hypothetical protein
MSLLGKIVSKGASLVKKVIKSPVAAMIPGPIGAIAKAGAALGIGGAAVKIATSTSKAMIPIGKAVTGVVTKPGVGKVAAGAVAGTIAGDYIYDAMGNVVGTRRKYRRMNVLNGKAATRAIRRVKGVRKMLQKIERQLPKAKAPMRKCA